jgi:hypothetical protein
VIDALITKVCAPSPSSVIALAEVSATAMGVSVIVAVADLLGSVLLVAVTAAVGVVTGDGAVKTPVGEMVPEVAVQVTPAFRTESPVTVAPNVWVAPPANVAVVGLRLTAIGVNVTVVDALLLLSAMLVAVTVAVAVVTGIGAV